MANILYSCCTTIQTALQNSITLTSAETEVRAIEDAAIVIRKLGLRERDYEIGHLNEATPGILIVPGPAKSPPEREWLRCERWPPPSRYWLAS